MKKTFTDFSQLPKAIFAPAPREETGKPEPSASDADGLDVLAYFSRTGRSNAARPPAKTSDAAQLPTPRVDELERECATMKSSLRAAEAARETAERRAEAAELKCRKAEAESAAYRQEMLRLQGECGRLQGQLRAQSQSAVVVDESPVAVILKPGEELIHQPSELAEAFPGETREMILASLADACAAAESGTRERRACVLKAVLAANPPTGELDRRRQALKQILKDCGYTYDPHALEKLGFRLVSGRSHWKLDYANVRMPIAKTPSDYRASLNAATDMANRCF